MSSNAEKSSGSTPGIPKIVLNEPSPLNPTTIVGVDVSSVSAKTTAPVPPKTDQMSKVTNVPPSSIGQTVKSTEALPSKESKVVELIVEPPSGVTEITTGVSRAETELEQNIEKFLPVADCNQCVVSVAEEASVETAQVQDDQGSLESQNSSLDGSRLCPAYGGLYGFYKHATEVVVDSKYIIPFLFFSLAYPIAVGYMASRHMDDCPMSKATPILLFIMSIAGTMAILARIIIVSRRNWLPSLPDWWYCETVLLVAGLVLVMCFSTELLAFFRNSPPSFDPFKPNYCNETFYNFTYWVNWVFVAMVVLLMFVHGPSCTQERAGALYEPTS